jgi:hypothetical protein
MNNRRQRQSDIIYTAPRENKTGLGLWSTPYDGPELAQRRAQSAGRNSAATKRRKAIEARIRAEMEGRR